VVIVGQSSDDSRATGVCGYSRASDTCRAKYTILKQEGEVRYRDAISHVVSLSSISQAARSRMALYILGNSGAKFFSR
jgi:hypothetical protein